MIITGELIDKVHTLLMAEAHFDSDMIAYEIQDDYKHLLISIVIDDLSENTSGLTFKPVAQLINDLMPSRRGHYTWMVVFKKNDKVVDSYFGGDLDHPNSGL